MMFVARMSEDGPDRGKWFMMAIEGKARPRRAGCCAAGCAGHGTQEEATEHHLQYRLDREVDLWLDRRGASRACEICGESTTLRARLGRNGDLFVLCGRHQSTGSLQMLSRRRVSDAQGREL
jgi:hypothetical protein